MSHPTNDTFTIYKTTTDVYDLLKNTILRIIFFFFF